jgi:gas vesicle protein
MRRREFESFVFGAAIVAGLGILFAPKKGKKTRDELKGKMIDLMSRAKELSFNDISEIVEEKITEIRHDLNDLDKEKVLSIAKEKSNEIKDKCQDLVDLAIDKGTPVLKNAAIEVRDKTVDVMKDMIKKLEDVNIDTTKNENHKNNQKK